MCFYVFSSVFKIFVASPAFGFIFRPLLAQENWKQTINLCLCWLHFLCMFLHVPLPRIAKKKDQTYSVCFCFPQRETIVFITYKLWQTSVKNVLKIMVFIGRPWWLVFAFFDVFLAVVCVSFCQSTVKL